MGADPATASDISELDTTAESSSMARLLEYFVLTEILQETWFGRGQLIDIMHSTVDAFGHDFVLECGGVLRHVQFKTRRLDGRATRYTINTRLAQRPSGCVVWVGWFREPNANRVNVEYRWFGGEPGEPLPELGEIVAKHTKANAQGEKLERPDSREVALGRFERLSGVGELVDRLFGAPNALPALLARLEDERGPVDADEVAHFQRLLQ